jgi:hypothetical protein
VVPRAEGHFSGHWAETPIFEWLALEGEETTSPKFWPYLSSPIFPRLLTLINQVINQAPSMIVIKLLLPLLIEKELKMYKNIIFSIFILILVIGCGVQDKELINKIKENNFKNVKTLTIGQFFENNFNNPKWEVEKSDKGETLVVFTGEITDAMHKKVNTNIIPFTNLLIDQIGAELIGQALKAYAIDNNMNVAGEVVLGTFIKLLGENNISLIANDYQKYLNNNPNDNKEVQEQKLKKLFFDCLEKNFYLPGDEFHIAWAMEVNSDNFQVNSFGADSIFPVQTLEDVIQFIYVDN